MGLNLGFHPRSPFTVRMRAHGWLRRGITSEAFNWRLKGGVSAAQFRYAVYINRYTGYTHPPTELNYVQYIEGEIHNLSPSLFFYLLSLSLSFSFSLFLSLMFCGDLVMMILQQE